MVGSGTVSAPSGNLDLSGLPSSASANTAAYTALNIPSRSAGYVFSDPATGLRHTKLTSNGTPNAGQSYPWYSTYGLQISQAWGTNRDKYTISYTNTSSVSQLLDYQLGVGPSNYRTGPSVLNDGRVAFSKLAGEEQILLYMTNTGLARWNTATNAAANIGLFPYTWTGLTSAYQWFQTNHDQSWVTCSSQSLTRGLALRLSDGLVRNTGVKSGLNEMYSGYNNVAFLNRGATASEMWDLDTDTYTTYSRTNSNFFVVHVPNMKGYWVVFNSNSGGNLRWARQNENGSSDGEVIGAGYWGQIHNSGHWENGSGPDQYFLNSCWDYSAGWATQNMRYSLNLFEARNFTRKCLGHHYSQAANGVNTNAGGTNGYWSQPHANQSIDGKLVIYGSNMLDSARIDLFALELPRT